MKSCGLRRALHGRAKKLFSDNTTGGLSSLLSNSLFFQVSKRFSFMICFCSLCEIFNETLEESMTHVPIAAPAVITFLRYLVHIWHFPSFIIKKLTVSRQRRECFHVRKKCHNYPYFIVESPLAKAISTSRHYQLCTFAAEVAGVTHSLLGVE